MGVGAAQAIGRTAQQYRKLRNGVLSEVHPVARGHRDRDRSQRRFRAVAVTSNKGGVGKTTVAANLAVYLRAMHETLPILILGLDEQNTLDRMFALERATYPQTIATALRTGDLAAAVRLGQYGIHYVPSSPEVVEFKREIDDPFYLQRILLATDWPGLVIIDTKADVEALTCNAIAASDLTLVLVTDHASLIEAQKVYDLLYKWRLPRERAQILLSLVDRRIKYRGAENEDILTFLVSEVRSTGYPLFESFLSRSAKVESLLTNPERRAFSILHGAPNSLVSRQMRHLAEDVMATLAPATTGPRRSLSEAR
jgi:chromosome partitioning protein